MSKKSKRRAMIVASWREKEADRIASILLQTDRGSLLSAVSGVLGGLHVR